MFGVVEGTGGGEGQGFNFDRWSAKNEVNDPFVWQITMKQNSS